MTTVETAPRGYTLVLPPGWTRVPLRAGTEAAVAAILDRTFAGHPQGAFEAERQLLQTRLREIAAAAAANAGLDLYLPTERSHGFTAAASFVVAELDFASVESPEPGQVLARIAAKSADTRTATIADTTAVRSETVAAADPARHARSVPAGSTTSCRYRRRLTAGWWSPSQRSARVIRRTSSPGCSSSCSTRS